MVSCQNKYKPPLVSVIISAYNAESFIEKTLNSVLAQSYQHIEVLVVDDGSQDQTAELVKVMAQTDARVILLQQKNTGVANARNLAIHRAKGELIAPIDADDIWHPRNLEKQVDCLLNASSTVGLVYSWSIDIDGQDIKTAGFHAADFQGSVFLTLLCHQFLGNASASLIRKDCLEKVGFFNASLKAQNAQGCEDWELYLRIAERYEFRVVPEFLVGYRQLRSSMSCNYKTMIRSHSLILKAVQQKYPAIPAIFYRFSSSSFYLHLARQCSLRGSDRDTLFLLLQVVKVDSITPFLRLGFYALFVKSALSLLIQFMVSGGILNGQAKPLATNTISNSQYTAQISFSQPRFKLYLKLMMGAVFHQLLCLLGKIMGFDQQTTPKLSKHLICH